MWLQASLPTVRTGSTMHILTLLFPLHRETLDSEWDSEANLKVHKFHLLRKGATDFCKGLSRKYIRFHGSYSPCPNYPSVIIVWKQPKTVLNKCAWLCSNGSIFTNTDLWVACTFTSQYSLQWHFQPCTQQAGTGCIQQKFSAGHGFWAILASFVSLCGAVFGWPCQKQHSFPAGENTQRFSEATGLSRAHWNK